MKIKIITLIIAILIIVMYVPVYADTTIPDPPPGAYPFWVVVSRANGAIQLYTSTNHIKASLQGKEIQFHNYKWYSLSDNHWSYEGESMAVGAIQFANLYASNHDIEYIDGSGFFFTLPKVSEFCQAVRQMKDKGTFGTILRTILDGLIPVLGLLILAISFQKGWAFLQSQLKH